MQIFKLNDEVTADDLIKIGLFTRRADVRRDFPPDFSLYIAKDYIYLNKEKMFRAYFLMHSDELELPIYPPYDWKVEADGSDLYHILTRMSYKTSYDTLDIGLAYYTGAPNYYRWWSESFFPGLLLYAVKQNEKSADNNPVVKFEYPKYSVHQRAKLFSLVSLQDARTIVKNLKHIENFTTKMYNDRVSTLTWDPTVSLEENEKRFFKINKIKQ